MLLKEHQYLSIGQAAKYIGLSIPTLRRYENEVIILEEHDNTFEQELVSSVLEIITVFSSKLYGKRSHKNKKTIN